MGGDLIQMKSTQKIQNMAKETKEDNVFTKKVSPVEKLVVTVSLYLIFSMIKNRGNYFRIKRRDAPPKCLTDPTLGTHHFIQLKDIKMHYVSKGDEKKPLMLFIHGFPEFWYSWRHQIREFAKDYHVIAVDNRGYGDTDKPRGIHNYTVSAIVEDTRQLVEALGKRDVVLVAHDWGGAIGWGFAAKHPELLRKLVIINSPHPLMFAESQKKGWKQFFYSWYMLFFSLPLLPEFALRSNDYFIFDHSFRNGDGRPLFADDPQHMEAYKYTFHKNGFTGPLNWYRALIHRVPQQQPKSFQIKVPTLIIWGKKDNYLTTELAPAHAYVDDLTVNYIDNCSHWTQMDQPTLVNQYMRQFVSKNCLHLLSIIIINPLLFMFGKHREAPPDCFLDSSLGTHHFIQLNDLRMHYVSNGEQNSQTLLFIHGFLEFWYSWRHQIRDFAKDYHVMAVDCPGYGDTDKPPGVEHYTHDALVDQLRQLLVELNKSRVILVGHDWGGTIAWLLAAKHPELIDRLVIINGPLPLMYRDVRFQSWRQFFKSWQIFQLNIPVLSEYGLKCCDYYGATNALFRSGSGRQLLSAEDMEAYKYTIQRNGVKAPLNWYMANPAFLYPLQTPKMDQIKVPALHIWGKKDRFLVSRMAEVYAYVNYLTIKYIETAGHWVQLEEPVLDIQMHYVSNGEQNSQTMLFIHGFPEFWYSWRHQIREFAKDYHVIAVDCPGYGDTDKPASVERYAADTLVNNFRQLLSALNKSHVIVVGHDWGGIIGWLIAAKHPDLIHRVIIMNAPLPLMYRDVRLEGWRQLFLSYYAFVFNIPVVPEFGLKLCDYYGATDQLFRSGSGRQLLSMEDMEAYKYTIQRNGVLAPIKYYRANPFLLYPRQTSHMDNIIVPALCIWGKKDTFLVPKLAEVYTYVNDLTVKYIETAGHWVALEEPELVNQFVRQFLTKE
ncbi:unnamed protein product, partial [Medioppia subpectinata]